MRQRHVRCSGPLVDVFGVEEFLPAIEIARLVKLLTDGRIDEGPTGWTTSRLTANCSFTEGTLGTGDLRPEGYRRALATSAFYIKAVTFKSQTRADWMPIAGLTIWHGRTNRAHPTN